MRTESSSSVPEGRVDVLLSREAQRDIHQRRGTSTCYDHWPRTPWSFSYYFNEGSSYFYVYLWILKDFSWAQNHYFTAHFFGGCALLWQLGLLIQSVYQRTLEMIWINVVFSLWLGGHYCWMSGELHDLKYPEEKSIYRQRTTDTKYIFVTASALVTTFFFIIKPLLLFYSPGVNEEHIHLRYTSTTEEYNDRQNNSNSQMSAVATATTSKKRGDQSVLMGRFPHLFRNWGEYENLHALFWLLKDTGWVLWIPEMVVVFFVPTFLLALDFVVLTLRIRHGLVDHVHYVSQLLWVVSASSWAAGEFYLTPNNDSPIGIFDVHRNDGEALRTSRWYASWLLVLAALPIVLLHLVWIPATLLGYIKRDSLGNDKVEYSGIDAHVASRCGSGDGVGRDDNDDDDDDDDDNDDDDDDDGGDELSTALLRKI